MHDQRVKVDVVGLVIVEDVLKGWIVLDEASCLYQIIPGADPKPRMGP